MGQALDWGRLAAQWNAVLVDGQWRFLDVLWASTVVVGRKSREWTLVESEMTNESEDELEQADGNLFCQFLLL